MSWMYRREYSVTHGKGGHVLGVWDRWLPSVIAEGATNVLLAALGHPCCGKGPLGRAPRLDLVWWKIMQSPYRLPNRDRRVLTLPLTVDQAAALRPDLVNDELMFPPDGTDEFGYTWKDAVMVGEPAEAEN